MINDWVTDNFKELQKICKSITKSSSYEDLCQLCIEQFLTNKKVSTIPQKELLYFFTRIVRNNYHSKSSLYYYTYNKYKFSEITPTEEIQDTEYEESSIDLTWVKEELNTMDWYQKRLFELFIEENCSITNLSRRTTIPLNSVSRDINKIRRELNKRRNKKLNN
jgi:DNA-directed RNA polymerase specialized sigma24 family protein